MSLGDERLSPLPCAAVTCPVCLDRLRALPVEDARLWRAYCRSCQRRLSLSLETPPAGEEREECRHSLAGGQPCKNIVKCTAEWPLELP